ncbi:MAG: PAS domain S-box protein [Desulfurivibrio sp.]|nr:MAG: PAS domain S-box protein [Desulfurivibrio sp.]
MHHFITSVTTVTVYGKSIPMKAYFTKLHAIFLSNAALRIAAMYAGFSALWILFSDQILFFYFKHPAMLTRIQIVKGWFFITFTALIIYFLLQREISRVKQSEDRARESERQLSTLMTNLPGMAYRRSNDPQWTMVFVSNGSLALTGYQPPELIDNRTFAFNNLIHADDRQAVRESMQQALARRQGYQLTYRLTTAGGQEKWVREQGIGIFSAEAELLALEGFITDITAEKQAEEALLQYRTQLEELVKERTRSLEQEIVERQGAEKKFRDLLESAPDAMALVDGQARIVLVNRQMENLFGYSREELLGRQIEILIPERYRARHQENVAAFFASPRPRAMGAGLDIHALAKDGREFPADISLSPLETTEGIAVLADIRNISERKQAEQKILKSFYFESTMNAVLTISLEPLSLEEQLERILEALLAIPLLSLQKMGSIYLVEEEAQLLVLKAQRGYAETVLTECSRVPFGTCLCGKAAETSLTVFADCLATCHKCYQGIFPHGHYSVPILSGARVLGVLNLVLKEGHRRDKQEEEFLSSIAATLAGIIVRKETEQEKDRLQQQLIEAEKLSALGRMMAGVAHEIRNPLTALGGLTRRLHKKLADDAREKDYTRVIISESTRLERILNSVLTLTREPSPHRQANDIHAIIEEALQNVAAAMNKKLITVHKSFAELPSILMAREDAREALVNVLANALYVTPQGGVISIATGKEDAGGKSQVTVKVTDSGPGIAEENLSRIFEPFFTTKPVGPEHGIGLGLSISRKILEEYGGKIRVESRLGAGATFTLFFPCPEAGTGHLENQ